MKKKCITSVISEDGTYQENLSEENKLGERFLDEIDSKF